MELAKENIIENDSINGNSRAVIKMAHNFLLLLVHQDNNGASPADLEKQKKENKKRQQEKLKDEKGLQKEQKREQKEKEKRERKRSQGNERKIEFSANSNIGRLQSL